VIDATLTDRECEILRRVAHGDLRKKIAYHRGRSVQTIKNQLTIIYEKLGAANAPHAVYIAMKRGLL